MMGLGKGRLEVTERTVAERAIDCREKGCGSKVAERTCMEVTMLWSYGVVEWGTEYSDWT